MALVRVKMIGVGQSGDAYRAPLPAYREILTNHEQGYVIALVPDDDIYESDVTKLGKTEATGHGPMLVELDSHGHAAWHAHLDERYPEHRGEYRPEVV